MRLHKFLEQTIEQLRRFDKVRVREKELLEQILIVCGLVRESREKMLEGSSDDNHLAVAFARRAIDRLLGIWLHQLLAFRVRPRIVLADASACT